jgi:hypothetical protein
MELRLQSSPRFFSTESIADVTIGNDCKNGGMSYRRKGKGKVIYFPKDPFSRSSPLCSPMLPNYPVRE